MDPGLTIVMSIMLGGCALAVGGVLWAVRRGAKRDAWEAAHPYVDVEPAQQPGHYRFIDAEELGAEELRAVDEYFARTYGRPGAGDSDPQVGDVVSAYVLWQPDGELVRERVAARVLWPRDTYVRGRLLHSDGGAVVLDVPRSCVAGILHLTSSGGVVGQ